MKENFKNLYTKVLEKLVYYNLKLQRFLFRKFFTKLGFKHTENLKQFLLTDNLIRETFIFKYGQRLFGGLHPKNVLNYRYPFFSENVGFDDVVLDVACGTGLILNKISPIIKRGIGLDYDQDNLEMFNAHHKKSNLEMRLADIYKIDYKKLQKETNYNVAIFSHFIEHVEDPISLLKNVDADTVLICVPSQEKWLAQLKKRLDIPFITDPTHFREYTRKMLLDELVSAGYAADFIGFNPEGEIIAKASKVKTSKPKDMKIPKLSYAGVGYNEYAGGRWKVGELNKCFPENFTDFNIVYFLSAVLPNDLEKWIEMCKAKNIKMVLNQNGVRYKAWYGENAERDNEPNKLILKHADFVVYQSEFSRLSADTFLGKNSNGKVIYNATDTSFYTAGNNKKSSDEITLMVPGVYIEEKYIFETAVRTLKLLRESGVNARLMHGGQFLWSKTGFEEGMELIDQLELKDYIELLQPYPKEYGVEVYRRADILMLTKYNDPCPSSVLEAMSCGLPIVYSKSGGTPELVGIDAGIGIEVEHSFDKRMQPEPGVWCEAVLKAIENRNELSKNARKRAVENFDIKNWIEDHKSVFDNILQNK